MPRWLAVVAVLAVAAVVCAFTVHHALAPAAFVAQLSQTAIPADGFSSSELSIRSVSGRGLSGVQVEVETPHAAVVESLAVAGTSATASLRAGVVPGEVKLRIIAPGFVPYEVTLRTTADNSDSVGDGTPDFLRLHDPADRLAFRRWFTLLAEAQFYRAKAAPEIDDCAALLRFSYREALRAHDASWSRANALPVPVSAEDVQQYQYPYTPLGADLFRVREGSFTEQDLRDGAFAQFADAETLSRRNTFLVGRDVSRARPGDLLFFRQDSAERMPFHAMVYIGNSQIDPGSEKLVVYHTGPNGNSPGQMKRLSIRELLNYPDARWQPVPSNPVFLGAYRWNILRGGE